MFRLGLFDIGATSVRCVEGTLSSDLEFIRTEPMRYSVHAAPTFAQVLQTSNDGSNRLQALDLVVIGSAGLDDGTRFVHPPYRGGELNYSVAQKQFGWKRVIGANDFELLAELICAPNVPTEVIVRAADLILGGTRVVTGPGTGLGLADAIWIEELKRYVRVKREGGHASFPAIPGYRNREFFEFMCGQHPTVWPNIEHNLCGRGLELMHLWQIAK